jgi:hypothetical protein
MANDSPTKICFSICSFAVLFAFGYFFLMLLAVIFKLLLSGEPIVPNEMIEISLPAFGTFKVPQHYFSLFVFAFSFGMSLQIFLWVKHFEKSLRIDFPVLATGCLFVSLCLLFYSCWFSSRWLPTISFFWVVCMTMHASCRYSSLTTPRWERKEIYSFIGSSIVCLIAIVVMSLFIYSQLKNASRLDYVVILPILLIVVPRWLMGPTTIRNEADFESSVWYQIYTVFIFIMSLAQIGFKLLQEVIKQVNNKGMPEWFVKKNINGVEQIILSNECIWDILSFFAVLSVVGLISYFCVFPKARRNI